MNGAALSLRPTLTRCSGLDFSMQIGRPRWRRWQERATAGLQNHPITHNFHGRLLTAPKGFTRRRGGGGVLQALQIYLKLIPLLRITFGRVRRIGI